MILTKECNNQNKTNLNHTKTLGILSLFISISLITVFGLNGSASATTSTITLSVTGGIGVSVMPSDDGTFASSTATNNVRVKTNSASGYELGIKASTSGSNNNALINATDSSKIIPSITSPISEATYSSSSTYNNTWGFKPSKLNSQANSNYIPGPTSTTTSTIIDKTTTANPSTFNDYTITLGTRIDNTQTPGAYANTFVITAVANPTPYSITYNKNTTDTVTNMPQNVSSDTFSDQVNLSNLVPARDGFNFKGWCTVQVADGGTCTGTTYNPDGGGTNLTWTLDQTQSSNSLTLYAMWSISSINLYDAVASMSKGTQTLDELRAAITTDNSGVYEYNSSVFGTSSDASNDNKIYYYRGILDNTVGSYGSDGDNEAHPNTVVLSSASSKSGLGTNDTCWRIVRTTGSGGVKMIYQGKWTGSTCANATTNAQVTTSAFSGTSSTYRQIVRVGYTHNSTYATNTSQSGTIAQIFGSNSNPGANNTRSTIKQYIEDTWYANNMTSYTSKLEASAGYCNDRTMNTTESWTTPLAESTTIASTYGTSGQQTYYFGADPRNANAAQAPSLTCGNKYSQIDRSTVDLYRYVAGSTGVSNQLKYPVALLTADEAAFAGSGWSSSTTPYHANSFLRSGSLFWLLSPYYRYSNGRAYGFALPYDGVLYYYGVNGEYGVRPAISLTSGTTAVSGTGTAADPWIVNPDPLYMQDVDQWKDTLTTVGEQVKVVDKRDGHEYWVAKQADGNIWMTQNLDLDIGGTGVATLTSENTDLNTSGTAPYVDGYQNTGGVITWTPDSTAITSGRTISGTTVSGWTNDNNEPYSAEGGDRYYYTTGTTSDETAQTLAECTAVSGRTEEDCTHYHSGNYYNWTAVIASNASSGIGSTQYDVAANSICPKGWKLPQGRSSTAGDAATRQFGNLWYTSGIITSASGTSYATDGFNNIRTSPLFFVRGGNVFGSSLDDSGYGGYYWSSSVNSASIAYYAFFRSSSINSARSDSRGIGLSVRCMVR